VSLVRRALAIGGAAAGVVGAAYATERAVVAAIRRRPDPDRDEPLTVVFDEARRLPGHDGGSISTIMREPIGDATKASDRAAGTLRRSEPGLRGRNGGEGVTVVFAHGLMLSVRLWVKQFDALPELGFRTIAFDQRGHGESHSGDDGYSVETLAWDVRTVLEGLDLRDVVLVGHSMGGIGVQAFALHHPDVLRERVRGIVLMSTFARATLATLPWVQFIVDRLSDAGPDLASLMARPNLGLFLTRIGFGRDPQPSHVELNRQLLAECARDAARQSTAAVLATDLTAELPTIDTPTLVLSGSADVLAPPAESRRIAELIPGARLETFAGAGHMLMLERAEPVNALIAEFARDVGSRAPRRRWWTRRPSRRRGARRPSVAPEVAADGETASAEGVAAESPQAESVAS
jgi:pimeloyl-ACP methyl ester carboxylesterase